MTAALLTALSGCSAVRALFGGRSYAFFGTQNGRITDKQLERCVGWVGGDTNDRICTLRDSDDFIAEYYVGGMMEQVGSYRALDTAGEDIPVPAYITDLGYALWGGEEE